ncbi:hypothetical protein E2C01_100601 [Portunus trituberculatus]|uniref:Uncharacterized protein n=1 Tax=Portunus trituberculatus TaxID=210409 RepID=A0A5B7KCM3_PORTR|nr:hypothetical protein [Portunus trituberculatus]
MSDLQVIQFSFFSFNLRQHKQQSNIIFKAVKQRTHSRPFFSFSTSPSLHSRHPSEHKSLLPAWRTLVRRPCEAKGSEPHSLCGLTRLHWPYPSGGSVRLQPSSPWERWCLSLTSEANLLLHARVVCLAGWP